MKGIGQARRKILKAKDIVISGHRNPDGDSIGSVLSLGLGLERLGKRVFMVSQDGVPKRYRQLPGATRIIRRASGAPDLAISVDCGTKEMLGETFDIFKKAKSILEIDHHEYRKSFGDISLIDHKAAAVGELIYILLADLNIGVTKDMALNILTSIIVETNSFRLPNIRALTFDICAKLIKMKLDFYKLVNTVFWSKSKASAILLGLCLSRCKFLTKGKMVWSIVREEDFDTVGGKDEDVDPVVDEMRSIRDVKIAILFRERKNGLLRVSMRSKGNINVASLAETFNGGGHFDAAGCYISNRSGSIKEFLRLAGNLIR
ncbi:MAG: bifunctional oligoribonuclease/PAP phosphatase NrnA [Candidatus Omnitrophica bacterium]|nr:bifunctional oligoribonuclease/PAP phosphatase NrnA [Candidatus Omnitrophota bacterium]